MKSVQKYRNSSSVSSEPETRYSRIRNKISCLSPMKIMKPTSYNNVTDVPKVDSNKDMIPRDKSEFQLEFKLS
jgi:hypothetical protein